MDLADATEKIEEALMAVSDDPKEQKQMRQEIIKSAAMEMDEDEKKDARALFAEDDDDNDDKEKMAKGKKGKKAKTANDDDDKEKKEANDDKDDDKTKIASLQAKIAFMESKPIITKMLNARQERGMSEKQINAFKDSLVGKSVSEIQQRYEEDKVLFTQPLIASQAETSDFTSELPFNAGLTASTKEIKLEDMFE